MTRYLLINESVSILCLQKEVQPAALRKHSQQCIADAPSMPNSRPKKSRCRGRAGTTQLEESPRPSYIQAKVYERLSGRNLAVGTYQSLIMVLT